MISPRCFLSFLIIGLLPASAVAEEVRIRVSDAQTGNPVAARAYLTCEGQPVTPKTLSPYRRGAEEHFLLTGDDTLDLPAAPCKLVVQRGLEYETASAAIEPETSGEVAVALKRWASMNESGWYSADMHVHRDPAELARILLAEDLNFAPTITYHVWSGSVSEPFPSSTSFPVTVDARHIYTANSQEVERIQGGPGAVILLAKELPIPFEGDEYYPPATRFTRLAHERGGYVEGDKLFWLDTPVNVALGQIDFIELNCNHFLPHDVDTDLVPWSHWPVEMGYHGDKGFALWMMGLYYRYLNSGLRLPLSAGSASGVKATPVGYDRIYVQLGDQPFTYDNYLKAMKAGRSFSTNGPLIDFKVNGAIGPGSELAVEAGAKVLIDAAVRSQTALEHVDLIVNGIVHRSYSGEGKRELTVRETLSPSVSSWIAVRAFAASDKTVVFAHTSPAYLRVGDQLVSSPEDARYLLNRVHELIRYTETKAAFRTPGQREETLAGYREARAVYQRLADQNR